MSTTTGILFIDVDTVAGYSLFKEGMYVAMDEYWYSIKKQIDGLYLGKMGRSFHSFVLSDHIFQISCIWGHLLSAVEGGELRVTRMLVNNSPLCHARGGGFSTSGGGIVERSDGWGTTSLQTKIRTCYNIAPHFNK